MVLRATRLNCNYTAGYLGEGADRARLEGDEWSDRFRQPHADGETETRPLRRGEQIEPALCAGASRLELALCAGASRLELALCAGASRLELALCAEASRLSSPKG